MSESTLLPRPETTEFGSVIYSPGGTLGPRMQGGLQLVAIEAGQATITVEPHRHHLGAGHVCLLKPGCREYFRFARHEQTEHTWCTMKFGVPDSQVVRSLAGLPFSLPMTSTLRDLIAMGLRSRSAPPDMGRELCNRLGEATFFAYVVAARTGHQPTRPHPASVERARQFVADHLTQPVLVNDIARAAGISPNQLTRLFKQYLNTTPSRYLWQIRTQRGVDLLRNTGLSLTEIADCVGFASPFHFSRLSKRLYGQSPKTLRKRFWGEPS